MKRSKICLAFLIVAVMLFSVAACSPVATEPEAPKAETNAPEVEKAETIELKLGCIVFQDDMFMQMWTAGVNAACSDYGVTYNNANSNNDASKVAELITTYIDQDYDMIAMQYTDPETTLEYVKKASAAGLAVGGGTTLSDEELEYYTVGLTTDQKDLGYSSGQAAVRYIEEAGIEEVNIGIVQFVSTSAFYSLQRSESFLKALDDSGIKYNVLADQDGIMQDIALTAATDMLTANPEINILYGANDGATIGTTMAVKNLGLIDKVAVFGCDCSEQIAQLLLSDDYSLIGTAAQDAYGCGYRLAEALIQSKLGQENKLIGKTSFDPAIPLNDYDVDAVKQYVEDISKFS